MISFQASERTTKAIFSLLKESDFLGKKVAHSTSSPENDPVHTLSLSNMAQAACLPVVRRQTPLIGS